MMRRGHYLSTWAIELEADMVSSVTQIIPGISRMFLCKAELVIIQGPQ